MRGFLLVATALVLVCSVASAQAPTEPVPPQAPPGPDAPGAPQANGTVPGTPDPNATGSRETAENSTGEVEDDANETVEEASDEVDETVEESVDDASANASGAPGETPSLPFRTYSGGNEGLKGPGDPVEGIAPPCAANGSMDSIAGGEALAEAGGGGAGPLAVPGQGVGSGDEGPAALVPAPPAALTIGGAVIAGMAVGIGVGLFSRRAPTAPAPLPTKAPQIGEPPSLAPIRQPARASLARLVEAVRANPLDAGAHFALAVKVARRGNVERAVVLLDRALRVEPGLVLKLIGTPTLAGVRDLPEVRTLLHRIHEENKRRLWTGYA